MDIEILKLVPCKQIYEMHIQMQHTSLWASPPTCVLKILIDLFPLSYISYLSPYVKYSPITHIFVSLPLCQQLAQKVSSNYR